MTGFVALANIMLNTGKPDPPVGGHQLFKINENPLLVAFLAIAISLLLVFALFWWLHSRK